MNSGVGLRGGLAIYRRALLVIGTFELLTAVAAFSAGTLISVAQIALRYSLSTSIIWAQEVSLLLFLYSYFVGSAIVFRMKYYVVVAFLMDRLPRKVQLIVCVGSHLLIILFWSVVVYQLILMIPEGLRTTSPMLRIPRVYFTVPLLVAGVSIMTTTIYYFVVLLQAFKDRSFTSFEDFENQVAIR